GSGEGTFQSPQTLTVGFMPTAICVDDFNGDKVLDLAVANSGSNTVSILLGNGNGSFRPAQPFPVGERPRFVAAGDLNGDQLPDLVVIDGGTAGDPGTTLSLLLGNGDGTLQSRRTLTIGATLTSVAMGDFNGDDQQDLALTRSNASPALGTVLILLGNGD